MTTATFEVTDVVPGDVIASVIRTIERSFRIYGTWTRATLARDLSGNPLESVEDIKAHAAFVSLLGAIESYAPTYMHPAVINAITSVCEERHWPTNLTIVNETIDLPSILELLEQAAVHAETSMGEEQRQVIRFTPLPRGTPSTQLLQARLVELGGLVLATGRVRGTWSCENNLTPSLQRAAGRRVDTLRIYLASHGDLLPTDPPDRTPPPLDLPPQASS